MDAYGGCPDCGRVTQIRNDGLLRRHRDTAGRPCPGSLTEPRRTPAKVDQTILAGDPTRLGNCVSACAATHLGVPLHTVPHFVEVDPDATVDGSTGSNGWWWLLIGFMAAHGLWPVELDDVTSGEPGELLWVAGPSPRGVLHQVLYRDGHLWHDPHPSRDGVLAVTEVLAWRPRTHDHTPGAQP